VGFSARLEPSKTDTSRYQNQLLGPESDPA
jgi:hypothetical protein